MPSIIFWATTSVHCDQTSTTLLYFSPLVMRPSVYCCSYSFTLACASADQLPLGSGNDEVVFAEGDAGARRVAEAERHHAVAENHRLLLAAMAVDGIDDVGHILLGQDAVQQAERHVRVLRHDLGQQQAARRGIPRARSSGSHRLA